MDMTINFGKTTINVAGALAMGEVQFKSRFKGILSVDINQAWNKIESMKPTNDNGKEIEVAATGIKLDKKKKSFSERLSEELEKKTPLE